jgi:2-oxoisovalerate dehydrogenase E1 component alpha subunit
MISASLRRICWANKFSANFANSMAFTNTTGNGTIFRVMDENGAIISPQHENIKPEALLKIYQCMRKLYITDTFFNSAQRQNRIHFYMPSTGEEASTVGLGAALDNNDVIFPHGREQGTLLWRGFKVQELADDCVGNCKGCSKGRNMPLHYSSKELNWISTSSPLTTQVPQASGAGYLFRVQGEKRIAVGILAEGAASEGDAHAAFNFAATLKSQTLFYCRNNIYSISTPIDEQYAGDGIAVRGQALGIPSIRVDGNDIFAVINSVKFAKELIINEKRPCLIESMSYRVGDHTTSDNSALYRDEVEMKKWTEYLSKMGNPITRLEKYIRSKKLVKNVDILNAKIDREAQDEVVQALNKAETEKKSTIDEMFNDVYHDLPQNILEQKEQLADHLKRHRKEYNLERHL